ncbi:MAG: PKD domain-containing protein [Patescibacteria group bacterium]|nr:PKD domain-containing protein [Patescibacteria group bacterium]
MKIKINMYGFYKKIFSVLTLAVIIGFSGYFSGDLTHWLSANIFDNVNSKSALNLPLQGSIIDHSDTPKTINTNGDVVIQPAHTQFRNGYLFTPDHADFDLGMQDLEIKMDIYIDQNFPRNTPLLEQNSANGNFWSFYIDNNVAGGLRFVVNNTEASPARTLDLYQGNQTGWVKNTWYTVSVERSGNAWSLKRDGVVLKSLVSNIAIPDMDGRVYIGGGGVTFTNKFSGYLKNVSVSRGIEAEDEEPMSSITSDSIMDQIECEDQEGYVWLDGKCLAEKDARKNQTTKSINSFSFVRADENESIPQERPIASIKFDPGQNIITGQKVTFKANNSTDGEEEKTNLEYAWTWDQRSGGFTNWSKQVTDSHTYEKSGAYNFVLRVRDGSGQTDTTIARINVSDPGPNMGGFTVEPEQGTTKTIFTFTPSVWDTLGTSRDDFKIRWDFDGNGTWDTSADKPQTAQIYYEAGAYLPKMLIINPNGVETTIKGYAAGGKPDQGRIAVDQDNSGLIKASFDIRPASGNIYTIFTFDAGDTLPINFNYDSLSSSSYAFRWDFDGDKIWDTPWSKSPRTQHQFSAAKKYSVTLEVNKAGYTDLTSSEVEVIKTSHPKAQLSANPKEGSKQLRDWEFDASASSDTEDGDNLMYRWDFDGDNTWDTEWSKTKKAYHQFTVAEHYLIKLEVRDSDLYTNSAEENIDVYDNDQPQVKFYVDTLQATRSHEFVFNTSEVSDRHTDLNRLLGRWDFEGDGVWDTDWQAMGNKMSRHIYETIGAKKPTLEVHDYEGLTSSYEKTLWVTENIGPKVGLKVVPERGFFSTNFEAVATANDLETSANLIKYNFDWDYAGGDINQTIKEESSSNSSTFKYNTVGWHTVRVEAIDEDNMIGVATMQVYIHPDSEYIDWVISTGASEYSNYDDFSPDSYITRAELLKMLYSGDASAKLPYLPISKSVSASSSTSAISPKTEEKQTIQIEHLRGYEYKFTAPQTSNVKAYDWDFDGNGIWDLVAAKENTVNFTFLRARDYNVVLELTTETGRNRLTQVLSVGLPSAEEEGIVLGDTSGISEPQSTAIKQTTPSNLKIPFADVAYDDWYAPYVLAAFQDDIMQGFRDRHFRPNEPVSAVGAIRSVLKMHNLTINDKVKFSFTDVSADKWYAPLASYAVENKIWHVDANDNFNPNNPITRAEAARMLYFANQISAGKSSSLDSRDVEISE